MAVELMPVDPDAGIRDLIRRLVEDSRRLAVDEVRLAKLELRESVARGGQGAMWLAVAFGVGVAALVAATLLVATLIGRLLGGHMWAGAAIAGAVEAAIGAWLVVHGLSGVRAGVRGTGEVLHVTGGDGPAGERERAAR